MTVRRGQVVTAEFAQILSDAIASAARTAFHDDVEAASDVETPSPRSAA
ncbi:MULTISPECIES: hypothetical protein [Actinoalloteichus]|nr:MULTISPECIES: hypothetical protein [Actinoalloteichus]